MLTDNALLYMGLIYKLSTDWNWYRALIAIAIFLANQIAY